VAPDWLGHDGLMPIGLAFLALAAFSDVLRSGRAVLRWTLVAAFAASAASLSTPVTTPFHVVLERIRHDDQRRRS